MLYNKFYEVYEKLGEYFFHLSNTRSLYTFFYIPIIKKKKKYPTENC